MASNNVLSELVVQKPTSSTTPQPRKMKALALERNNLKWELHRDEIQNIYIDQDKTLKETMTFFEQERGFTKSLRKWKDKLKEWKLEKNVPSKEMSFMAAKAEKRKIEEGKDTEFYRSGILVDGKRIEHFKKRNVHGEDYSILNVPETPSEVTYSTPQPSSPNLRPIEEGDEIPAETLKRGSIVSNGQQGCRNRVQKQGAETGVHKDL